LDNHLTFTDQICYWFKSIGKDCVVTRGHGDIFDTLQISSFGKVKLTLKLIDLESWINSKMAENEALSYKVVQSKIRLTGILSVVLWEDVWQARKEIVKSRLEALLGISQRIPGRLTVVRRIDKQTASGFLNKNHLQGSVSSKTQYGLYLPKKYYRVLNQEVFKSLPVEELLVAVATFSHPRIFRRDEESYRSYEMIRFANLVCSTVVGGVNKLISAFVSDFHPGDLMTYADLEWSEGTSYARLGFESISDTGPIGFWLDPVSLNRVSKKTSGSTVGNQVSVFNLGSRKFVRAFNKPLS